MNMFYFCLPCLFLKDDISLHGYKKHLAVKAAPGPLSALEEDIKYVNELEGGRAHISVDSKHETMKSVGFPVVREATEALRDFKNKKVNYVQLVSSYLMYALDIYIFCNSKFSYLLDGKFIN